MKQSQGCNVLSSIDSCSKNCSFPPSETQAPPTHTHIHTPLHQKSLKGFHTTHSKKQNDSCDLPLRWSVSAISSHWDAYSQLRRRLYSHTHIFLWCGFCRQGPAYRSRRNLLSIILVCNMWGTENEFRMCKRSCVGAQLAKTGPHSLLDLANLLTCVLSPSPFVLPQLALLLSSLDLGTCWPSYHLHHPFFLMSPNISNDFYFFFKSQFNYLSIRDLFLTF